VNRGASLIVVFGLIVAACSSAGDGGAGEAAETTDAPTPVVTAGPPGSPPTIVVIPPDAVGAPPDVDMTIHSVPLEEVFFDTFDGGAVPLSDSTPALRERLLDAIPPIDEPIYDPVSGGDWLAPTDLVLGYVAGGQAYAYPFKILNFHEIVNDVIDDVPVLISYCPLCRSGVVYDRRIDGQTVSFGNTSALYESDLVMVDRATGSYWWQVAGKAIVGPLTDTSLEPLPSEIDTWRNWRTIHPDTLVLSRDTGFARPYANDSFANYTESLDTNDPPFSFGTTSTDGRLAANALVVGLELDGTVRAYPIDDLEAPINDVVGTTPVVIFPTDGGAVAYRASVDGVPLVFAAGADGIVDEDTGSRWTSDGMAIVGGLAGTRLERVPMRTTFWFAFIGAFPETEIFGG
jgi:hypothetical protein